MNAMYNRGKTEMLKGLIDWDDDTIEVLLIQSGSGYTYNADHNYVSGSIADNEVSGGNYSRQTLVSKSVSQDDSNDYGVFDAADVIFSGSINAESAVMFKNSGSIDSASVALFYTDNQFPAQTSGGNIKIIWSDEGILAL